MRALQYYLASTTLPEMVPGCPMPLEGSRSHSNILSTRYSPHRKLAMMHMLDESMFGSAINDFLYHCVPKCAKGAMEVDPITRDLVTVPNEPYFSVPEIPLEDPCSMMDLYMWLCLLPVRTAQRIIHFIYPQTKGYRAALRGFTGVDSKIFQYIKWGIYDPDQVDPDIGDPTPNLILAFQPPWILSPQDLEYFVRCRKFPPDIKGESVNFNSRERLWAKIWDLCVERECPYFVLTSYDSWVFGVFSKGWTRAFLSPIRKYSDDGPTVLECLIYWICSSMGMPGGFKVPEVSELVQFVSGTFSIPAPASRLSTIQPSESWSGGSEEIEYESHDDDSRSDYTIGPVAEMPHPIPLARRVAQYTDKVQHWFADQPSMHEMPAPQDWREVSPALSDVSDVSATSGVRGYGNEEIWQGGWLTGDPGEAHAHVYVH